MTTCARPRFLATRTVTGLRWTIKENFHALTGLTGLDEPQARRWPSWYRRATLAMLASATLTIATALERACGSRPADQIPQTRNEIAHLISGMVISRPATRPRTRCAGSR